MRQKGQIQPSDRGQPRVVADGRWFRTALCLAATVLAGAAALSARTLSTGALSTTALSAGEAAGQAAPAASAPATQPLDFAEAVKGVMRELVRLPDADTEEQRQDQIAREFDRLEGKPYRITFTLRRVTATPNGLYLVEGKLQCPASFTRLTPWPLLPKWDELAARRTTRPLTTRRAAATGATPATRPAPATGANSASTRFSAEGKAELARRLKGGPPAAETPRPRNTGVAPTARRPTGAPVKVAPPPPREHIIVLATRDPNANHLPAGVPLTLQAVLRRVGFVESDQRTDRAGVPLSWPNRVFSAHSPGRTSSFDFYLEFGEPIADTAEHVDLGLRMLDTAKRPANDPRWAGMPFLETTYRPEDPEEAWSRVAAGMTPHEVASLLGGHQAVFVDQDGRERRTWVFRDMTGHTIFDVTFVPPQGGDKVVTAFIASRRPLNTPLPTSTTQPAALPSTSRPTTSSVPSTP